MKTMDAVLEEIRLDQVRVGKFRSKHKADLHEFALSVVRKLDFAVNTGMELAEKADGSNAKNYSGMIKTMFDAWADPRVEQYFLEHPMHEIIDMRQFGKLFAGTRFQAIVEDSANKKCVLAVNITVSKEGIDVIKTSKKPALDYDFLIRGDLDALYLDSNLSLIGQYKRLINVFSSGKARIRGWRKLFKLVLYIIKELITIRLKKERAKSLPNSE